MVSISSGDDVEIIAVETDPVKLESQRIKRLFLMSGVPDQLKKQAEAEAEIQLDDHPPIPTTSHVQQREDRGSENQVSDTVGGNRLSRIDPWDLDKVTLPVKTSVTDVSVQITNEPAFWSLVSECRQKQTTLSIKVY